MRACTATIHTPGRPSPAVGRRARRTTVLFGIALLLPAAAIAFSAASRRAMLLPPVQNTIAAISHSSTSLPPRATAHPVSSNALPHVAGKRLTAVVVEFPPGGYSPPHHHGGSVTVFVLSGAIRSQLQGQTPAIYKTGDSFFEPPGIAHLLAENASATKPARILAVHVADEDAVLTVYHE
jgi:quercetin dioxygenase-like cupin family protein